MCTNIVVRVCCWDHFFTQSVVVFLNASVADTTYVNNEVPPGVDPEMACVACNESVMIPSILCVYFGSTKVRMWNDKKYRYKWCLWCARLASVLYAWLSMPGVVKLLKSSELDRSQWPLKLFAYMSLRMEGGRRTQTSTVTIEKINQRARMFRMFQDWQNKKIPESRGISSGPLRTTRCPIRLLTRCSLTGSSHRCA